MNLKTGVVLFGASGLCGCAMLTSSTQEQNGAARFAAGAHAVSVAEMAFLHRVQSAECSRDFYASAFEFASASRNPKTKRYPRADLDLFPDCTPQELTDAQLQNRQTLMNALALYGDAMQTLLSGNNDKTLGTDSEAMVKGMKNIASQEKFTLTSTDKSVISGVNAAVVSITQIIIDHREYANVKAAAAKAEPSLEIIVNALKSENVLDAEGLKSKLGALKNEYKVAILASRDEKGAASFIDIANAHAALTSLDMATDVTSLNKSLDALVSTNKALASGDKTGIAYCGAYLVSEAQNAMTLYNGSK